MCAHGSGRGKLIFGLMASVLCVILAMGVMVLMGNSFNDEEYTWLCGVLSDVNDEVSDIIVYYAGTEDISPCMIRGLHNSDGYVLLEYAEGDGEYESVELGELGYREDYFNLLIPKGEDITAFKPTHDGYEVSVKSKHGKDTIISYYNVSMAGKDVMGIIGEHACSDTGEYWQTGVSVRVNPMSDTGRKEGVIDE